ncbi:MAG: BMC domain-containing protein, partial [Lachnospiraceae bacterium]|nr:BMC domain-containing protein [Lachnospiraceae bacterium]
FITWERKMGGRLVTLIVQGEVAAVTQAVETACAKCIKKPVSHGVIANPHSEIVRLALVSASRFRSLESVTERAKNPAGEIEPPIW